MVNPQPDQNSLSHAIPETDEGIRDVGDMRSNDGDGRILSKLELYKAARLQGGIMIGPAAGEVKGHGADAKNAGLKRFSTK